MWESMCGDVGVYARLKRDPRLTAASLSRFIRREKSCPPSRGVEDAAPYDTAENFCFIPGTNRDKIRANCAIIKLRQTVGFPLR